MSIQRRFSLNQRQPLNFVTMAEEDKQLEHELLPSEKELYQYFVSSPYMAGFDDLKSKERDDFLHVFNNMPQQIKKFLIAAKTAGTIFSNGRALDLTETQISDLSALVRETVIGNIFLKDLPDRIVEKLKITSEKANDLTNKIIAECFSEILEEFKRIQKNKFGDKIQALKTSDINELRKAEPVPVAMKPAVPAPSINPGHMV